MNRKKVTVTDGPDGIFRGLSAVCRFLTNGAVLSQSHNANLGELWGTSESSSSLQLYTDYPTDISQSRDFCWIVYPFADQPQLIT